MLDLFDVCFVFIVGIINVGSVDLFCLIGKVVWIYVDVVWVGFLWVFVVYCEWLKGMENVDFVVVLVYKWLF